MQTEKHMNGQKQPKKVWRTPRLAVHGPVEKITAQVKWLDSADGILLGQSDGDPVPIGS